MQVKGIALTLIKLPYVIKIFILSIFEWPFYKGFAVLLFGYFYTSPLKQISFLNFWKILNFTHALLTNKGLWNAHILYSWLNKERELRTSSDKAYIFPS